MKFGYWSGLAGMDGYRLPCGQCVHCRLERKDDWVCRIMHERQLHDTGWFITLTYDDKHLPCRVNGKASLVVKDAQDFMKRMRKDSPYEVRYFLSGEYGEKRGRPHYHLLLFGYELPDLVPAGERGGHKVFRSRVLSELWQMGDVVVGSVSPDSAAYVAGYCVDKVTGRGAAAYYGHRVPEYAVMSLRPGLGFWWFLRYWRDVYPIDRVVVNGREKAPPRTYDIWLAEFQPEVYREVQERRAKNQKQVDQFGQFVSDTEGTPERLYAQEQVTLARLSYFSGGDL